MKKIIIFPCGYHGRKTYYKFNKKQKILGFFDNFDKRSFFSKYKKPIYKIPQLLRIDFDQIYLSGPHAGKVYNQLNKIFDKSKIKIINNSQISFSKHDLLKRSKDTNQLIKFFLNICEEYKINYFFVFSSLLAAARKQDLAELSDVDILVLQKDYKKLQKIFSNKKKFKYSIKEQNVGKKIKLIKEPIKNIVITKKKYLGYEKAAIDIAPIYKKKNKFIKILTYEKSFFFNKKFFSSYSNIHYKGLYLRVPKYHKQFLSYIYGKNWKIKNRSWKRTFFNLKNN